MTALVKRESKVNEWECIEEALRRFLFPAGETIRAPLREAMEYAVFPGGKRLRPRLALMACRAMLGKDGDVLPAAVALELIHCYSLVHDDLPAMDDDDLRRGRPTCHKAFGEAMAVLAGDALLTRALEVVARHSPRDRAATLTADIAAAAGVAGMVGGQAGDLLAEQSSPTVEEVEWIHQRKTAALIQAAVRVGAVAAGGTADMIRAAEGYGQNLGLAFQIVDDILGCSGTAAITGKPVGRDEERGKVTYPAAAGEAEARRRVEELTRLACQWARRFPRNEGLLQLALKLPKRVS